MAHQIDKDILIGELINVDINIVPILMGAGMHCIGCGISRSETVLEACEAHRLNPIRILSEMNRIITED